MVRLKEEDVFAAYRIGRDFDYHLVNHKSHNKGGFELSCDSKINPARSGGRRKEDRKKR